MTMGHESSPRVQKLKKEYEDLIKNNPDTEDILRKQNYEKLSRGEDIDFDGMKKKFDDATAVSKKIDKLKKEIESRKERGQNVKYIIEDVKEGSLVSYLINKNDKDIKNPISVLNIKPYINEEDKNDYILVSDEQMYGQGRPEFKQTVDNILSEINGVGKEGFYCLNEKLYADSPERIGVFSNDFFEKISDEIKKYYTNNINIISEDLYEGTMEMLLNEFSEQLQDLLGDTYDEQDDQVFDNYMYDFDEYNYLYQIELGKNKKEMIENFKKCFLNEINNNNFFNRNLISSELTHLTKEQISGDRVIKLLYNYLYEIIFKSDCSKNNFKNPMNDIMSDVISNIV